MKKITLCVLALIAFQINYAQNTCSTATAVTDGSFTAGMIVGSEVPPICTVNGSGATASVWYSYTATLDGTVTISSDLAANMGGDTRLHIYEGSCGSLVCTGGNDDVDGTNFLSSASFPVTNGETYYFAWDDRWSDAGFDFTVSSVAGSPCQDGSVPYTEDFSNATNFSCHTYLNSNSDGLVWSYNDINDFDGDGTNDPIINLFPADNTSGAKDDWIISSSFNMTTSNTYTITVRSNSIQVNPGNPAANESFDIVILDGPSPSDNPQIIESASSITPAGTFGDTTGNDPLTQAYTNSATFNPPSDGEYHVGIHATSAQGDVLLITEYSINSTLSIDEFNQNTFTHNYNKTSETLNLESSSSPLSGIEIYSLLGQSVMSKTLSDTSEAISVASLNDGIYLAKVNIGGNSKTIKFLKN